MARRKPFDPWQRCEPFHVVIDRHDLYELVRPRSAIDVQQMIRMGPDAWFDDEITHYLRQTHPVTRKAIQIAANEWRSKIIEKLRSDYR